MKNLSYAFLEKTVTTNVETLGKLKYFIKLNGFYKPFCSLFIVIFMLLPHSGSGQNVSSYCFVSSSGSYSVISGTTLTLASGTNDDGYYPLTSIGFNFTYAGTVFTYFSVSTNGYIQLGTSASSTTVYTPLTALPNCIAFCGGNGKTNTAPSYITLGTAPNRVLTIQFNNWYVYNGNTTNTLTVQVKLYETTNVVQIVYSSSARTDTETRQVGLTGATVSDFNDRTTTTNWFATTAGATDTAAMTWSPSVFPAIGLVYTWSLPPVITTQPATSLQNVCPNGSATPLTVAATGASGYQWYSNNTATNSGGTLISGATSSTYAPSTAVIGTLYYYCVVSNACISLTSNVSGAIVVSNPPDATNAIATPSTICSGLSSSLSALAPGYTIDWYTVSTGGTSLGNTTSGGYFVVSPTATTTYYAEAEGSNAASQTFSYTGSIATWTVPTGVSALTIIATGGGGGAGYNTISGGYGASISGTFTVTPGQVLDVVAGGKGVTNTTYEAGAGGGGSYIWNATSSALLEVGGGGGGGSFITGYIGANGSLTTTPTVPAFGTTGTAGTGELGGAGGSSYGGGGGAGYLGNGGNSTIYIAHGGNDKANGFTGGAGYTLGINGGFGGGGGAGYFGGGGGGGYNGAGEVRKIMQEAVAVLIAPALKQEQLQLIPAMVQ